jgi:hypothetical protein
MGSPPPAYRYMCPVHPEQPYYWVVQRTIEDAESLSVPLHFVDSAKCPLSDVVLERDSMRPIRMGPDTPEEQVLATPVEDLGDLAVRLRVLLGFRSLPRHRTGSRESHIQDGELNILNAILRLLDAS